VHTDQQNYGVIGEGGPATMAAQEEKTWSVLAHLTMFLNLFTGFLGPVVALIIWLVYRDRSRKVAFHALQSMWYQVAWLVILAVGWAFTGLLTMILIGFLLIPLPLRRRPDRGSLDRTRRGPGWIKLGPPRVCGRG
jgi:uncharacterized membrane protein